MLILGYNFYGKYKNNINLHLVLICITHLIIRKNLFCDILIPLLFQDIAPYFGIKRFNYL